MLKQSDGVTVDFARVCPPNHISHGFRRDFWQRQAIHYCFKSKFFDKSCKDFGKHMCAVKQMLDNHLKVVDVSVVWNFCNILWNLLLRFTIRIAKIKFMLNHSYWDSIWFLNACKQFFNIIFIFCETKWSTTMNYLWSTYSLEF